MPPQQPYNPYQQPAPMPASSKKRFNSLIIPFVLTLLLLFGTIGFGAWAFTERQSYKNDVDGKINDAVAVAVQKESDRKDNEFVEKEKEPLKTYSGPDTYGSLFIRYPKTWSGYVIQKDGSTPLDGYFHPNYVPGTDSGTAFALRVQVVGTTYDQELKKLDGKVKNGKVKVSAYSPKNVTGVKGSRITGEINADQQDTMVMLPLRDKTIKIWTESSQFVKDFDNIILANFKFVP